MSSSLQSQLNPSSIDQATRIPDIEQKISNFSRSADSKSSEEQIVRLVTDAAKHEPEQLLDFLRAANNTNSERYWTINGIYILMGYVKEGTETFIKIFDFICSEFITTDLNGEGKVLWLLVSKMLIRWPECLYQKILDASVALLSNDEEERVIEAFMDFLYLIGQQPNFNSHFSLFNQEKEQLLLTLCSLYRQASGTNAEKKLIQNLNDRVKCATDFLHFCKFLERQEGKDFLPEAIKLSVPVFQDYFNTADYVNIYLRSVHDATVNTDDEAVIQALASCLSLLFPILQRNKDANNVYSFASLHMFLMRMMPKATPSGWRKKSTSSLQNGVILASIDFFKDSTHWKKDICKSVIEAAEKRPDSIIHETKIVALENLLELLYKDHEHEAIVLHYLLTYLSHEIDLAVVCERIEKFIDLMKGQIMSSQFIQNVFNLFQKRLETKKGPQGPLEFSNFRRVFNMLLRLVSLTYSTKDLKQLYQIVEAYVENNVPNLTFPAETTPLPTNISLHFASLARDKLGCHLECALTLTLKYLTCLSKCVKVETVQKSLVDEKIACYSALLGIHHRYAQISFDEYVFTTEVSFKHTLEKIILGVLEVLHAEMRQIGDPKRSFLVSIDLIHHAATRLKMRMENHSLFCLLEDKTLYLAIMTFYHLSCSERSMGNSKYDPWKSYRQFLTENDTADVNSLDDLNHMALSTFALLFSYERFLPDSIDGDNVFSTFLQRLAKSCRPMLASEKIKHEQRNAINFNTMCLTSLKVAAIELPTKYWKFRLNLSNGTELQWLVDHILYYFRHSMARNWPMENVPWFLEFLSTLIRRNDLCHIFTGDDTAHKLTLKSEDKSNNYINMFELFALFIDGDVGGENPSDQHLNITMAYSGILKLYFRLSVEKRARYLNYLISHGKCGLLYKSGVERIENKLREKQSQNRRSSFGAKGKEEKEKLEKKLKEDITRHEKLLHFNKDIIVTIRDILKHSIMGKTSAYSCESLTYSKFFDGCVAKHWIRGYNIHSFIIPVSPCGVDYMEVIRKPAGMVRKYISMDHRPSDLTPEIAYLWSYDVGFPKGRNPEESIPVRITQNDFLEQLDRYMPFSKAQVALVYVGPGQSSWTDIFNNSSGSLRYMKLVNSLGTKIPLRRNNPEHDHAVSGLDDVRHGKFTYFHDDDIGKIQYTVATVLPTNSDHQKLATIGNREIMVTWDESGGSYIPGTQDSDFPFVEVILRPQSNGIVKIDTVLTSQFVQRKTRLPSKFKTFQKLSVSEFKSLDVGVAGGPIFVSDANLAPLVTSTVVNNSLTLSFTDSTRRRVSTDSYMETIPAYHRLTLIQNMRDKELAHQNAQLQKSGHIDHDFDLDLNVT